MQLKILKNKKIIALVLALCLSAAFLFPVGLIFVYTNHTHTCCGDEYRIYTNTANNIGLCCKICINVHNAKNLITVYAASGSSVLLVLLWLSALYLILKSVFSRVNLSPVSLKVRMNN
ncbi:MAG: hypothetical protein FWC93_01655 [Defluviitaleaceae bacterium]|nr:hypothetical protein [Defluviitaleaceae bacterium]